MIIQIENFIDQPTLTTLTEILSEKLIWQDGKDTAAGSAKSVKADHQADREIHPLEGPKLN